jgi:signal transduction histidine kinase
VPEPTTRTERYFRIFGVMLLVFVIGNGPLVRLILSPLEKLALTAKAFGAGDLNARANLDRQDEIGDLGRAFDEMATRVEAFRRAEKELLANVSHELRTPLARIRVVLELAAEKFPEAAQRYTTEIAADLTELEQLIDDIIRTARFDLTNARVGDPYPPLNLGQVPIGAFVESLGQRFAKVHPERTVVFDVDYELAVAADPMMLKRALGNVLENAHKYSAPSGGIAIRVERDSADSDRVSIAICDNGPGLDPADAALVFTPFFRGQRERKSDAAGIGLGLTLAQRIVEAHGGSIRLRSAPSEGTTVTVTLPLQSED